MEENLQPLLQIRNIDLQKAKICINIGYNFILSNLHRKHKRTQRGHLRFYNAKILDFKNVMYICKIIFKNASSVNLFRNVIILKKDLGFNIKLAPFPGNRCKFLKTTSHRFNI